LKGALEQLEKKAEDKINKDDSIKPEDKAKAIEEAKAEIGKEALLKAIEDGVLTATQAVDEFLNDANTKDKAPEAYKTKELTADETKKIDEAAQKEASKPIVKKLTDIADDLAEKIEKLTNEADEDKADAAEKAKVVEEKNAALEKQKETLEKAKTALETAKKNNADQAIQDGLQDAVTKLEASVASAKAAADEAKANFDEVNEAVQEDDDAIAKLTENYNAILGYIENLKEVPKGEESKDFSGSVNPSDAPSDDAKQPDQVPSAPNAPEFNGGVNPSDSPSGNNGSDFNGGVNDATAPTVADAPEHTGPLATDIPVSENGEAVDAPKADTPDYKGPLATNTPVNENGEAVEALKAEIPEYTGPLSTNGEDLVVNNVPAYAETGAPAINEVPEYTLTTAGTNKDNTYQAPAAKAEDKKELPNTGGKDNVAVASLGFLGLFLGAIPFVKRKN